MILPGGIFGLDPVEEADEFLMPVALHAAADDLAFEHIEGRTAWWFRFAYSFHAAPRLQGQAGLGAVERLDLRFLINAEHHRVRRECSAAWGRIPDRVTA